MPFPARNQVSGQRFISSRQLLPGDWANGVSDALYSSQSVTAAGTTQADAAQINAAFVEVLNGSAGNSGVKLPAAYPGAEVTILNNSANSTKIWPSGTDQIQNAIGPGGYAGASASVTITTLNSALFICVKAGFWQVIKTTAGP